MQQAAAFNFLTEQLDEITLDQTPFVMSFLVPGVGKINPDLRQRGIGNFVFQHFHRIVLVEAGIFQLIVGKVIQQTANTGSVHFHADKVAFWLVQGSEMHLFAVAETDFEYLLGRTGKNRVEIFRLAGIFNPVLRPVIGKGTFLRERDLPPMLPAPLPAAEIAMVLAMDTVSL